MPASKIADSAAVTVKQLWPVWISMVIPETIGALTMTGGSITSGGRHADAGRQRYRQCEQLVRHHQRQPGFGRCQRARFTIANQGGSDGHGHHRVITNGGLTQGRRRGAEPAGANTLPTA